MNTPSGKISKQEAIKSGRDAILIALGGLIPQLLEIANMTDFGDYTAVVSIIVAMVSPLVNRFLRS